MISELFSWLLIIAGSLFGIAFVYFAGWYVLESIAPDAVEKFKLNFILTLVSANWSG